MTSKEIAPLTTVRVEPEDINAALPADQFQCAIVRAVQRRYPTAKRVRANSHHIAFTIDDTRYIYDTPKVAVESIIIPLDTGGKPEPQLLRLESGTMYETEHMEPLSKRDYDIQRKREGKGQYGEQGRADYGRAR